MQKNFAKLNYYEMLDIKPAAAAFEIRHAYNAALQVYQPDSLASYSFFSAEERGDILSLIEKAYATLINEQARREYDDNLIARGELRAREETTPAVKKPVSIFDISRSPIVKKGPAGTDALKNKISQSPHIGGILAKSEICGADLKSIRNELGAPLEQIAQDTKIRMEHLRSIEEDDIARLPAAVFLKGFVKAYLKCLCLEPVEAISARYMEAIGRLLRNTKAGRI